MYNFTKRIRLQTGTADKRSVDVGQRHQFGYIVRFDAPSIQDSHGFCKHIAESFFNQIP